MSHPASRGEPEPVARVGIGEVLVRLRRDFADVTLSKIRFLESAGLVAPARTPSGYRKFSEADLDRLRYVLATQRDHYLPLKVIKQNLAAIDRGVLPPVPSAVHASGAAVRLTRDELATAAATTTDQLIQLESLGLVRRHGRHYDAEALEIARTAARLAQYGAQPAQLRSFRTAADREAKLVERLVASPAGQRDAAGQADEASAALADLAVRLHAALFRARRRDLRGPGRA